MAPGASYCVLAGLCALLITYTGVNAQSEAGLPLPLQKAHAHNDYDHPRALFEALDAGFCSIEVDPWLVNGTLYVAHDAESITEDLTIENLYLDPLSNLVAANQGYVYKASKFTGACNRLLLLIDFKGGAAYNSSTGNYSSDPSLTALDQYAALDQVLRAYQDEVPGLFTEWFANGTKIDGSIDALISGSRPSPQYVQDLESRLAALDGRVPLDLSGDYDSSVYPLVSQNWCCTNTSILGMGHDANDVLNITDSQLAYVASLTTLAHQQGRIIRYWNTPDTPEAWELFFDLNTDLINTDRLQDLRTFILDMLSSPAAQNDLSLASGSPYTPATSAA